MITERKRTTKIRSTFIRLHDYNDNGEDDSYDDGDEDNDDDDDLGCLLLLSAKGASQPVDDQRRKSVQPFTF